MADKPSQQNLKELLQRPMFSDFIEELQKRIEQNPGWFENRKDEVIDFTLENLVERGHQEEIVGDLKRNELYDTVKEFFDSRKPGHP